ncbi:MAG TPA: serine/threonine-protein kinase [Pirellulaceae bacterium]|nr:serine/threonine-protein kinase [Pirellulaceae bacterium]
MAKNESLTDTGAFVDHLDKSGLLTPEQMVQVRKSAAGQADASSLARQLVKNETLTAWQAAQILGRFTRLTVGKYRLLGELGKGPMGRVFLAEHGKLNKRVSLKVLPSRFSAQAEVLKRFLQEATRASALNHRNIIHLYDVGDEEGRFYLAMEYVEGKDLQRQVEEGGPMPAQRAIDLARQAADGLSHAHEQDLSHGDLKPSNLLVDASGVVKILDLGLSELADSSTPVGAGEESTEAPSLASLAYRAPELLGDKRRSDVRSDLYSLGAILHFLLTGKPPARDNSDVAEGLLKVAGVVPELANVCDHLLASDPNERPESAAQVVAALELAQRALPTAEKAADKSPSDRQPAAVAKRPLVAKPLEVASTTIVATEDADAAESPSVGPLGFAIKTGRKRKSSPAPAVAASAPAASVVDKASASPRSKRAWPVIPIAVIGGGALVLAIMVTVVVVLLNRGGSQPVAKATRADAASAAKVSKPTKASESKPESNPESNPETNPIADSTGAASSTPPSNAGKGEPTEKGSPTKTSDTPAETKGSEKAPAETKPMPMPATTTEATPPTATPGASTTDTKTTKAPASETKPEPAPTTPMPAPAPAPAANPFAGFATAVALPPLETMGKPAAEALNPVPLGLIKIEPTALCLVQLKGGQTAYKGKSSFLLEPANGGTAPRDWEIKFQSEKDPPVVVASLALKDDQLVFQWAEEATRQQSAPFLCNCALSLSAGTALHQVALRKPITAEPLAAQVDKGVFSETWNIESPPPGKQVTVEIGPLEGGAAKHKVDPKFELEAFKDTTYLMAGHADDALILGFKIDVAMPAKSLRISAQPQYYLTGMPKPDRYMKVTPKQLADFAAGRIKAAQFDTAATKAAKNLNAEEKKQRETQANQVLEAAQKGMAQIEQLKELAKSLPEGGKIHFRAYFMADDVKVDLINSGAPPAPPPMPPAAKQ